MGLIGEIQQAALDDTRGVTNLLRKALVASSKLGVTDIEQWIRYELNRYPADADLPDYRLVRGQVLAKDEDGETRPVVFEESIAGFERARVVQAAAELEAVVRAAEGRSVFLSFSHERQAVLRKATGIDVEFVFSCSPSAYVQALDAVRTRILEWALALERQGIVGEGLTFTAQEVQAAGNVTYDYSTHIGSMHHSQLQQHSSGRQVIATGFDSAALHSIMTQLIRRVDELGTASAMVRADAATVILQLESGAPKATVLRDCLQSIRSVLEGSAGGFLGAEILPRLVPYIGAIAASLTS
jgi:hypothetical protein